MVINTQETNIEQSNNSEFYLAGIFFVYMLLGAAMALGAGLANILSGPLEKWAFFITIIGVFISCWAVYNSFRISDQSENKRNSKDFLKGMLMGFLGALLLNLLNAVIINIIPVFADKVTKVITYILLFITLFSITMNALLINSNLPDEVRMVISNISGFVDCFGIVIGGTAIATIDDSTKRSNWMIGFLVLTMFSLVIYGFLWATNPI